jgi:hypothetical protein
MMTAAEFIERATATIEDLALLYAGTPDDMVETSLMEFAERTRTGWRNAIPWLAGADIDSVAADVVERVRIRRREIEQSAAGMA